MIVVVCGGKDFDDWGQICAALDYWHARLKITLVVQGGEVSLDPAERDVPFCDRRKWGAGWFAQRWAILRGVPFVEEALDLAEWKKTGGPAAPLRNRRMLEKHRPDRVITFPGTEGFSDMLNQARARGIKCIEVA